MLINPTLLVDFSTPEYTTYGVVKQDKWERCELDYFILYMRLKS